MGGIVMETGIYIGVPVEVQMKAREIWQDFGRAEPLSRCHTENPDGQPRVLVAWLRDNCFDFSIAGNKQRI